MRFVFPCAHHERGAIEFAEELRAYESEIHGTGGLDEYLDKSGYADWLMKVWADIDIANIPEGRVPAITYLYVRQSDQKIVGMINIRLALNDFLRHEGGHIGYCIRPSERQKGYATRMLREALVFCRTIGMKNFIIVCDRSNPASAGVIKSCGGVLDAEFYSDIYDEVVQRYIIE